MKKFLVPLALTVFVLAALTGCSTMNIAASKGYSRVSAPGQAPATAGNSPYHVIRTQQLRDIPAGSTIGIVSATGPSAFGILMSSSLEKQGLTVREMNLYAMIPPGQQFLTDPKNQFTFTDTLVKELMGIIKEIGVDEEGTPSANVDLNAVLEKMYAADDLVTERQRVNHYIDLAADMKRLIGTLGVDYILVAGSPYTGLCYSTTIYDAKTFDVVFSNIIIADQTEWRRIIPVPQSGEGLSFNFEDEKEPFAFWDLSYCEYICSKIKVR